MQQSNSHMFCNILGLGGTHVQQSFRSRRNTCAAGRLLGLGGTYVQQCFVSFYPHIYVPHFAVYSKAIQYVFTLLHVFSTPRGPPARKSSHHIHLYLP